VKEARVGKFIVGMIIIILQKNNFFFLPQIYFSTQTLI